MALGDVGDDREPEAHAGLALACLQRLEEARELLVRDVGTVVAHRQDPGVLVARIEADLDLRIGNARNGVGGVLEEVEHHELDLPAVDLGHAVRMHAHRQLSVGRARAPEGLDGVLDDDREVGDLARRIVVLGVGAHALDDLARAFGLQDDLPQGELKLLALDVAAPEASQKAVAVVGDGAQRLLELVRDDGRHLAHDARALEVRDVLPRLRGLGLDAVSLAQGVAKRPRAAAHQDRERRRVREHEEDHEHDERDDLGVLPHEALEAPARKVAVGTDLERVEEIEDGTVRHGQRPFGPVLDARHAEQHGGHRLLERRIDVVDGRKDTPGIDLGRVDAGETVLLLGIENLDLVHRKGRIKRELLERAGGQKPHALPARKHVFDEVALRVVREGRPREQVLVTDAAALDELARADEPGRHRLRGHGGELVRGDVGERIVHCGAVGGLFAEEGRGHRLARTVARAGPHDGDLLDAAHGLLEGVEGLVRDEEVDASRADRLRQVAVVQIIDVHVLRAEHDADELLRRVDHLGVRL